jgi:hypothetical protein
VGLTLALAQPLYCKTIRVIGEYYFWYDQILALLPRNRCFVEIDFMLRLILSFYLLFLISVFILFVSGFCIENIQKKLD